MFQRLRHLFILLKSSVSTDNIINPFLSDVQFTKKLYISIFGKPLNLKNPQKFSEKIQWLKLYNQKKIYETLSDKYQARDFVKDKIGEKYLPKLLGVYFNANDIDFNTLPSKFVLKTNHGSSWNIICDNKSSLDIKECREKLNGWLKENYYFYGREYNYRHIKPLILCEEFLGNNIRDYKVFCFNGKAKYIWVDFDRHLNHTRNIYDLEWNQLPFSWHNPNNPQKVSRPKHLQKMIKIAEKLANGFDLVRVDLYYENEKIKFSELTFYPGNGMLIFNPDEYDYILGQDIQLPK